MDNNYELLQFYIYKKLIKKKEEYSNIPLENMTEEQLADMRELEQITSDLVKMFPELVI